MKNYDKIEYIVCAAMLMDDGKIITGVRHFSPDMRETLKAIYGRGFRMLGLTVTKPYHMRILQQGFITNFGRFVNREDAYQIALKNKQIRNKLGLESWEPPSLYSEHLY